MQLIEVSKTFNCISQAGTDLLEHRHLLQRCQCPPKHLHPPEYQDEERDDGMLAISTPSLSITVALRT